MSVDQTTSVRDDRDMLRAAAQADPEAFERMARAILDAQEGAPAEGER